MRRFFVCTALCLFLPTGLSASPQDELPPLELLPHEVSFAYSARHGAKVLPAPTLGAMWFNEDDRDIPNVPVAAPIVVTQAQSARITPSREGLCGSIAVVAAAYDLPAPFFANLIQQESGFRSHVISRAGAQGIAQFMPRTARAYGLENPFDATHSLSVSARFLSELLGQFGNLGLAAAAYNAGPTRVQNWIARRGALPEETRNYVLNITGHPAERWARIDAKTEGTVLPAHARCPDMPEIEVAVPEAAPVKVAKGKGKAKDKDKADTKAAAAKEDDSKEAGPKKPYTLASMTSPGRKAAVIADGKLKIMAPEKGAKPKAAKPKAAAKPAPKTAAKNNKDKKPAAKPAAKSGAKVAAKPPAKPAAKSQAKTQVKSQAKSAAKSQSKPAKGKSVKLATAR